MKHYSPGTPVSPLALRRRASRVRKEYMADLYARTLRVGCPCCGASAGAPCVAHDGRTKAWTHYHRRDAARRVGLVKGRWYD